MWVWGALVSIVHDVVEAPSTVDIVVVRCVVAVAKLGKEEEEYDGDDRASSGSVQYSEHPSMQSELIEATSPISIPSPRVAWVAF